MVFKVDKDVPIWIGRDSEFHATLRVLNVGDSFLFDGATMRTVNNSARHLCGKLGIKITCRTVEGGVRIWRIE